jgi:hypothetical protein
MISLDRYMTFSCFMFGEDAVQHIDFLPDAWRNYGCLRELFIDYGVDVCDDVDDE